MYQVPSSSVLIRRKQVEALTSLSRSRIYALINEGAFPKPVRLGAQSVAWSLADIEAWVSKRIAESKESKPVTLITRRNHDRASLAPSASTT